MAPNDVDGRPQTGTMAVLGRLYMYNGFTEFTTDGDVPTRIDAGPQWIVDFETSYTMKTGLTISAGAQNLFESFPDRSNPGVSGTKYPRVCAFWVQRRILLLQGVVCILRNWATLTLLTPHPDPLPISRLRQEMGEGGREYRGVMNRQLLRIMSIGIMGLALALTPLTSLAADEAQALFNQGALHSNNGEFQQAAESLKQALEIFPRFAAAHHLLGVVSFSGLQQPDQAVTHLKKAVELHPNFARAYFDLGWSISIRKTWMQPKRRSRKPWRSIRASGDAH